MLRQMVREYDQQQNKNDENMELELQQDKMDEIKLLVKEKNDLLTAYDDLKMIVDQTKNELVANQKNLSDAVAKNNQLQQELDEHSDRYLADKYKNDLKIKELTRKLKISKNELIEEYEKKEQAFIQTVEEQLKYIDELENE